MSTDSLEALVVGLEALDLQGLRQVWEERIGPAPRLRSPELLRLNLAWRLQAAAQGGLSADLRRQLRQVCAQPKTDRLSVGARLAREWLGVTHEVEVTEGGYLYAGRTWKSLSQIARQIAGSRWNGPRFFGLRDDKARAV